MNNRNSGLLKKEVENSNTCKMPGINEEKNYPILMGSPFRRGTLMSLPVLPKGKHPATLFFLHPIRSNKIPFPDNREIQTHEINQNFGKKPFPESQKTRLPFEPYETKRQPGYFDLNKPL